jgi:4-hydroxy-4-methyl-2-oxoglutarate aldolase
MASTTLADLNAALVASVDVPVRLLGRFEPSAPAARCVGPAVTVRGAGGDNRALYRGLAACRPGDVLVVALDGSTTAGHWGSLLTQAALSAGIAGLVIDGAVRDRVELAELGLPIFFRGLCPRKAIKADAGDVGATVLIDGQAVRAGDYVVADVDGVVAFAAEDLPRMLDAVGAVIAAEAAITDRIRSGASLGEAFGIDDLR